MAKIELPEGWAGVTEPLRALMAEVEREAHADCTTPPDLVVVSARWARVSDAIRAMVGADRGRTGRASTEAIARRGEASDHAEYVIHRDLRLRC